MSDDLLSCHHRHHLQRMSIPVDDCFAWLRWKTVILTVRSNSALSQSAPSRVGRVCTLGVTAAAPCGSCDKAAHVLGRYRAGGVLIPCRSGRRRLG